MASDVKIPPMGESITSGVLAKWHVQDGDLVKKDQPLFELETDKITSEGTAESAGKITCVAHATTFLRQLGLFLRPRTIQTAGLDKLHDAVELVHVEPNTVRAANIHDDPGTLGEIHAVH